MIVVDEYAKHVNNVLTNGHVHTARDKETVELLNTTITVPAGYIPGRVKMNRALGYMEMLQLIGWTFSHEQIRDVAPHAQLGLFTSQSAYGPRVRYQLRDVVNKLVADRGSRQAVILVASTNDQLGARPCTTSAQFQIRASRMHATFAMRSSDCVWGLPYDLMQFGGLAQALGNALDCYAAEVCVFAGSSHVYRSTQHLTPLPGMSRQFLLPEMSGDSPEKRILRYREWALAAAAMAPWPTGVPLGVTEVPHA